MRGAGGKEKRGKKRKQDNKTRGGGGLIGREGREAREREGKRMDGGRRSAAENAFSEGTGCMSVWVCVCVCNNGRLQRWGCKVVFVCVCVCVRGSVPAVHKGVGNRTRRLCPLHPPQPPACVRGAAGICRAMPRGCAAPGDAAQSRAGGAGRPRESRGHALAGWQPPARGEAALLLPFLLLDLPSCKAGLLGGRREGKEGMIISVSAINISIRGARVRLLWTQELAFLPLLPSLALGSPRRRPSGPHRPPRHPGGTRRPRPLCPAASPSVGPGLLPPREMSEGGGGTAAGAGGGRGRRGRSCSRCWHRHSARRRGASLRPGKHRLPAGRGMLPPF